MRKEHSRRTIFALIAVALATAACHPGFPNGPSSITQRDSVVTLFDDGANFGAIRTYGLADLILEAEGSDRVDLSPADEAAILARVDSQMQSRGYTKTTDPNAMDAVLLVTVGQTERSGWVVRPCAPRWGGWIGWRWPGWGCWYPWAVPYSFTVGTVFVEMFDPSPTNPDVPPGDQLAAVWAAALDGYVTSAGNVDRALTGIEQAFAQSPYLRAQ